MDAAILERYLALAGAIVVGVTAFVQLRNDWDARGLDAVVTKVLLGLMALGCIFALLAALHILGAHV